MARGSRRTHHPSLLARISFLSMAGAAVVNLFRQLRMVLLTWAPSHEEDSEIDRAGRMGELKVSDIFRKISGVQVFDSLRIPDTENRGRREIDLVLLTKRKIYVVEIKNWSGVIKLEPDGSWCQIRKNGSKQKHPNIVGSCSDYVNNRWRRQDIEQFCWKIIFLEEELIYHQCVSILMSSLSILIAVRIGKSGFFCEHDDFFCRKIRLRFESANSNGSDSNDSIGPEQAILMQPEVLTEVEWQHLLDQDLSIGYSTWLGSLFSLSTKDVLKASVHEQLQFILSTTPTWDRMQLEGGRIMVGDFLQFKGNAEDAQALKIVKRPNVSNLAMVHSRSILPNLLGLLVGIRPAVKIIVAVRDFRERVGFLGKKQRKETVQIKVNPDLQIIFRIVGTNVAQTFKINSVVGLSLSV